MIFGEYFSSMLDVANVFISLFVLVYAWSFLKQTADVRDRKPWVFLFIAAVVFFIFELVGVLGVFDVFMIPGLQSFLESVFIALILFVFIFQFDLILKSDLILITRKIAREEHLAIEKNEEHIREHLSELPSKKIASPKKASMKKTSTKKKK